MSDAAVSPRGRTLGVGPRVGPKVGPTSLGVGPSGPSSELLAKLLESAKHNPETREFTMSETAYYMLEALIIRLRTIEDSWLSDSALIRKYGIPLSGRINEYRPQSSMIKQGGKYKSRRHPKKHHNKRRHTRRS